MAGTIKAVVLTVAWGGGSIVIYVMGEAVGDLAGEVVGELFGAVAGELVAPLFEGIGTVVAEGGVVVVDVAADGAGELGGATGEVVSVGEGLVGETAALGEEAIEGGLVVTEDALAALSDLESAASDGLDEVMSAGDDLADESAALAAAFSIDEADVVVTDEEVPATPDAGSTIGIPEVSLPEVDVADLDVLGVADLDPDDLIPDPEDPFPDLDEETTESVERSLEWELRRALFEGPDSRSRRRRRDDDEATPPDEDRPAAAAEPAGSAGAHYEFGLLLVEQERYAEALDHFEDAAALGRETEALARHHGLALSELGDHEAAAERFATAVERDPESAAAHLGCGAALARAADSITEEAATYLDRAVELGDGDTDVLAAAAECYAEFGRDDRAREIRARTGTREGHDPDG